MARLALAACVLAGCGDNLPPPAMCDGIEPVFAHVVPLHALARTLPNGDVLLAGTFRESVVIGDQTLTSAGGSDIFIARIGASISVTTYGDAEDQELLELATNGAGGFAIAGKFRGTLDLGTGILVAVGTTSSMFVAQLGAYSRTYPVEAILRALALSPAGELAISGTNFDPIDFGGGVLPTGAQFLGVLDAKGDHVTSRSLASEDLSVNLDVGLAFDGSELVVAGSYTSSIDLGGGPLPSAGAIDFYLARFARGGAHRASHSFGGPRNDGFRGFDGDRVTIAPSAGDLVLASSAQPALDDSDDIFVTRLDAAFEPIWNQTFERAAGQAVGGLAVSTDGTIAITGISAGATIAGMPAACGLADASHAFAMTLDADGHVRWSRCFPADFAAGLSVSWRGSDELVLAGTFSGVLEIGDARLESENLSGFVVAVRPACTK
ncbi:MAG: hypothetical protein M4D80_24915 [Myxococcota bacterium]|nr:hypothetical protein [Myxococcota bacterium]